MENKYNQAKIYKIIGNGLTYYGSTYERTLARRLAKHKNQYKHYLKGTKNYITSFEILATDNYEIVLVENYPCNSKDELHARERYWIENNECINKQIPSRTKKEWCESNKDKMKEWREANKDKIKECREANKEKASIYQKARRENSEHCECNVCGSVYLKCDIRKHIKTKKHIKALELTKFEV